MNFDTYKIKDELLEIYSDSEENFSVGKILSKVMIAFFLDPMMNKEKMMVYIL